MMGRPLGDDNQLQELHASIQSILSTEEKASKAIRDQLFTDCERKSLLHSILGRKEVDLRAISPDELSNFLKPALEALKNLNAHDLLHLEKVTNVEDGVEVGERSFVKPIHERIKPSHNQNTVRYLHINEVESEYSVGIFVFPPNARIPLHDHPRMCVLSRVLYGELHRQSLDLLRDPGASSWMNALGSAFAEHRRTETTLMASNKRVDRLVAPQCTSLFPYEGNLHEFVAGPRGAAVLDVLLPPYDHGQHRDCTFYRVERIPLTVEGEDEKYNLVPHNQPNDFECISGSYGGLGLA